MIFKILQRKAINHIAEFQKFSNSIVQKYGRKKGTGSRPSLKSRSLVDIFYYLNNNWAI